MKGGFFLRAVIHPVRGNSKHFVTDPAPGRTLTGRAIPAIFFCQPRGYAQKKDFRSVPYAGAVAQAFYRKSNVTKPVTAENSHRPGKQQASYSI